MAESGTKKRSGLGPWQDKLILIALIIVIAAGSVYFFYARQGLSSDTYQAVFLTSGQVYFGKITKMNEHWVNLEDVYYLQRRVPIDNPNQIPTDLNLVRLGSEIHGPENRMQINREHVLFIEQLSPNSQILGAIRALPQ